MIPQSDDRAATRVLTLSQAVDVRDMLVRLEPHLIAASGLRLEVRDVIFGLNCLIRAAVSAARQFSRPGDGGLTIALAKVALYEGICVCGHSWKASVKLTDEVDVVPPPNVTVACGKDSHSAAVDVICDFKDIVAQLPVAEIGFEFGLSIAQGEN